MSESQKWMQVAVIVILALAIAWFIMASYSARITPHAMLVRVFATVIVVLGVGIGAGSYFASFFPPIFAITATGILSFFGLLTYLSRSRPDERLEDRDLRVAIAGSITTMYLILVGYGVWVSVVDVTPNPIAQGLMNSFSAVVGTVIAFYFGASAYTEAKIAEHKARSTESKGSGSDTATK